MISKLKLWKPEFYVWGERQEFIPHVFWSKFSLTAKVSLHGSEYMKGDERLIVLYRSCYHWRKDFWCSHDFCGRCSRNQFTSFTFSQRKYSHFYVKYSHFYWTGGSGVFSLKNPVLQLRLLNFSNACARKIKPDSFFKNSKKSKILMYLRRKQVHNSKIFELC